METIRWEEGKAQIVKRVLVLGEERTQAKYNHSLSQIVEVSLFSFISLDFLPSSRTSKFSGFCFAFSYELCDKLRLNGENAELCKHLNVEKHISLRGSVVRTEFIFSFFSLAKYTFIHTHYTNITQKQQKRKQLSIEMKCLGKKKLVKIVHQQIKKKIIQKTH